MKKLSRFAPVLLLFAAACAPLMREAQPVPGTDAPTTEVAATVEHHFATPAEAASAATGDNPVRAEAAIKHLRAMGPAGMAAMRDAHAADIAHHLGEGPATLSTDPDRVLAAIDAVSGSKDGWASGLYWHTDAAAAMAAAESEGKPILNLWLLGNLDDEFC